MLYTSSSYIRSSLMLTRRLTLVFKRFPGLLGLEEGFRFEEHRTVCSQTAAVDSEFIPKGRAGSKSSFRHFYSSRSFKTIHIGLHQPFSILSGDCSKFSCGTFISGPAYRSRSRNSDQPVSSERETSDFVTMAESELVVGHDQSNNLFYITLDGGSGNASSGEPMAKLEYSWIRPSLVDLYHTEVPTQFRGKGVAKILAKAAFDFFCEKEVTMRPSCTYLQKYLKDNPTASYLDRVEKDYVKSISETAS